MGCCIDFNKSRKKLEDIVSRYYKDYKIFTISRDGVTALGYKVRVGIVVLPDDKQSNILFEALLILNTTVGSCIKAIGSTIDKQDTKMVELFVVEIKVEM